jgi:hypothetical protein
MKKAIVFIGILTLFSVGLFAIGESGGSVFDMNSGARPASMAGVFIAKADDINSIWYNPAGIANIGSYELGFTYDKNVAGIRNAFVSFVMPFETIGSIGIGILHSTIQDDVNNAVEEAVKVYDIAGILGYSYAFSKSFLLGANIKYLSSYLGSYSSSSIAFDAGALYYMNKLGIGLVVQNIGTSLKFESETTPLPLKAGVGLNYEVLTLKEHLVSLSGDVKYNVTDEYLTSGVAAEYLYDDMFSLRVGYIIEQKSMNGITAGAGVKSVINDIVFKFDYAFLPKIWADGGFDTSHMISLMAQF